ncbi:hypothetical protein GJ744_007820 [Endocarpon pusillum]|uniref:Uncharacterized protein n=1 Tax=Endocarpon pusillum TaxID=364733 RepID=A0A8H7AUH2_9EURO|nr:hypothetical protein GJ744_007820 [Endocarpon pusillum]
MKRLPGPHQREKDKHKRVVLDLRYWEKKCRLLPMMCLRFPGRNLVLSIPLRMRHPTSEIILSGVSADRHLAVSLLRDMFDEARAPLRPSAA